MKDDLRRRMNVSSLLLLESNRHERAPSSTQVLRQQRIGSQCPLGVAGSTDRRNTFGEPKRMSALTKSRRGGNH